MFWHQAVAPPQTSLATTAYPPGQVSKLQGHAADLAEAADGTPSRHRAVAGAQVHVRIGHAYNGAAGGRETRVGCWL